jgi:hypothetical protein
MNASRRTKGMDCCASPIKGAMNQPKSTPNIATMQNAVAMQPKQQGVAKIKGTVNGPKP